MSTTRIVARVDDEGVHLPAGFEGSCDVTFDGHHAWSFSVGEDEAAVPHPDGDGVLVVWPRRMRSWLQGASRVQVLDRGTPVFEGDVVFGSGEGRVSFVDRDGIPVMIDKWGLLQRPFSGRDRSVVTELVDVTERILAVMAEQCGVQGWIAFGTLLGAAREGGVIGHDSDVDLAYLSDRATPAEMAEELYGIARALRADGMRVLHKSGSFVTVVFTSSDGAMASIDVYTCFYVGDLLHETATVRAVVPRSAIEPVGEIEFEGRMLPAPAQVERMLAVSYGPGWRVPDPSFSHEPGHEVKTRFDGWFGNLMRQRRDWESALTERGPVAGLEPSDGARRLAEELEPGSLVVDVGCGTGADALHLARAGIEVVALDYARQPVFALRRAARREQLPVTVDLLNLYDGRDVLSRAALLARKGERRRVLHLRHVVESLAPDGRAHLWRFVRMVLRGGGRLVLEAEAGTPHELAELRDERGGGRVFAVDPLDVVRAVQAAGGRVTRREGLDPAVAATRGGPVVAWRLEAHWEGV